MRIDSHQHFWKYDSSRHDWINNDMHKIRKDFMPQDLAPLFRENNIDGCVLVQVDQTEAETEFCLNIAEKNNIVKGVVGWIDLQSDAVEERLAHYATHENLKGIRHIVQAEHDEFMLQPNFQKGIAKLSQFHLTYDILIYPPQLPSAITLTAKFPEQPFVLDHIAKPYIKDRNINPWATHIKELAQNENVFCKISGMLTEAHWETWKPSDLHPYLEVIFDAFGCDRIMYGSDWPVCLLAASYKQVLESIEAYISQFSSIEQEKIMGGNAIGFYKM